jgi:hypothetical protein
MYYAQVSKELQAFWRSLNFQKNAAIIIAK